MATRTTSKSLSKKTSKDSKIKSGSNKAKAVEHAPLISAPKPSKSKLLAPKRKASSAADTPDTASHKSPAKSAIKSSSSKAAGKSTPRVAANGKLRAPPPPEASDNDEAAEPSGSGAEEDDDGGKDDAEANADNDHLHGFSSDDDDSSDDDQVLDKEIPGIDVTKLPTIAKDDAAVQSRLEKAKRQPKADRGVIYIGRLPHGFYEDQLRAYFTQFGNVTRLRISRNKKTGRSKHRAFIEFDSSSVAEIVAETMDNYLLLGHIVQCKIIPKDEVHPELWVGANRKWRVVPRERIERKHHDKPRTEEERERAAARLIKRQNDKKRKLAAMGIDYTFDDVAYKKPKAVQV